LLFTRFVEATAAIESAASAIYIESLLKTSIAIRSSSSEIGFRPDHFGVWSTTLAGLSVSIVAIFSARLAGLERI
jgi:hypothetical protein